MKTQSFGITWVMEDLTRHILTIPEQLQKTKICNSMSPIWSGLSITIFGFLLKNQPKGNLKVAQQLQIDENNPLLKPLAEALLKDFNFPKSQLKVFQRNFYDKFLYFSS